MTRRDRIILRGARGRARRGHACSRVWSARDLPHDVDRIGHHLPAGEREPAVEPGRADQPSRHSRRDLWPPKRVRGPRTGSSAVRIPSAIRSGMCLSGSLAAAARSGIRQRGLRSRGGSFWLLRLARCLSSSRAYGRRCSRIPGSGKRVKTAARSSRQSVRGRAAPTTSLFKPPRDAGRSAISGAHPGLPAKRSPSSNPGEQLRSRQASRRPFSSAACQWRDCPAIGRRNVSQLSRLDRGEDRGGLQEGGGRGPGARKVDVPRRRTAPLMGGPVRAGCVRRFRLEPAEQESRPRARDTDRSSRPGRRPRCFSVSERAKTWSR